MAGGRPSKFSQAIADKICGDIATSNKSLKRICASNKMPSVSTVLRWLGEKSKSEFREQYARAQEARADLLIEEILEIADDGSNDTIYTEKGSMEDKEWTSRSKLRVESRKWIASKYKPKRYGDKIDVTSGGETISTPMPVVKLPDGTTIQL